MNWNTLLKSPLRGTSVIQRGIKETLLWIGAGLGVLTLMYKGDYISLPIMLLVLYTFRKSPPQNP